MFLLCDKGVHDAVDHVADLAEKTIADARTLAIDAKQLAEGVLVEKSGSLLSVASSVISDAGSEFSTRGKRHRGKKERPHEEEEAALFAKISTISMNENASNVRGSSRRRRENKQNDEEDSRSSSQLSNDWQPDAGRYIDSTNGRGIQDGQQRGSRGGPSGGTAGGQVSSHSSRNTQTNKHYQEVKRPRSRDFNESHGADRDDDDESQEDKKDERSEKAKEVRRQAGSLETVSGQGSTSSAHRSSLQGAANATGEAERSSSSLPENKLFATTERNSGLSFSKQERRGSDYQDERRIHEKRDMATGSNQQTGDDDEASKCALCDQYLTHATIENLT
jgi:hypothetical protein